MGAFWKNLWALLEAIRAILGRLGAIWEALRIILGLLEASWMRRNVSRSHCGIVLQYLGTNLGPFASVLG